MPYYNKITLFSVFLFGAWKELPCLVAVVESQTLLLENKSVMLQVPEDKQGGGGVRTTFEHTQSSSIANMSMAAATAAHR